jgi:hypothetical protein
LLFCIPFQARTLWNLDLVSSYCYSCTLYIIMNSSSSSLFCIPFQALTLWNLDLVSSYCYSCYYCTLYIIMNSSSSSSSSSSRNIIIVDSIFIVKRAQDQLTPAEGYIISYCLVP